MSFLRHREIYPSDGDPGIVVDVPSHRLDEFPVSYFSASYTPALLASASPTVDHSALMSYRRSILFHRTVNSVLTVCLSPNPTTTMRRNRDAFKHTLKLLAHST